MRKLYVFWGSACFAFLSVALLSHEEPFLIQQRYVITFDRLPTVNTLVKGEGDELCLVCHGARVLQKTAQSDASDCNLLTSEDDLDTTLRIVYPAKEYTASYYHADSVNGLPTIVIELYSKQMIEQLNRINSPVLWYS